MAQSNQAPLPAPGSGGGVGTAKDPITPKRPPAFTIETTSDRKRWLNMMVYGDYGMGKTTLAGSASKVAVMQDVLMIDAEAGDLSLAGFEGVDVIRVKNYRMASQVEEFLKMHCKLRDADDTAGLCELESTLKGEKITKPRKYHTVIVDTLSEVETYCMYQLLGITLTTSLDEETAVAEWPEFRRNFNMISRFVRTFRDLPMHVIMTCSQQYVQDDQKRFNFAPSMTGKLSGAIQGFFDVVGWLTIVKGEEGKVARRLYVQPIDRFAAKNRFAAFKEPYFENPTISGILKAVGLSKE